LCATVYPYQGVLGTPSQDIDVYGRKMRTPCALVGCLVAQDWHTFEQKLKCRQRLLTPVVYSIQTGA
jgi:hypothetical protein